VVRALLQSISPNDAACAPTHRSAPCQHVAIHMIPSAARILLTLGPTILIGDVAAGSAQKRPKAKAHLRRTVNEHGEPFDQPFDQPFD
jgi:hypothetical protein